MRHTPRDAARKRLNEKGFTLIELLIVIAIIGILLASSIMTYLLALNRAHLAGCRVTLNTVGKGMEAYNSEHDVYPSSIGSFDDLANALKNEVDMTGSKRYVCEFVSFNSTIDPVWYTLETKIRYNIPGHGMNLRLDPSGITETPY